MVEPELAVKLELILKQNEPETREEINNLSEGEAQWLVVRNII